MNVFKTHVISGRCVVDRKKTNSCAAMLNRGNKESE